MSAKSILVLVLAMGMSCGLAHADTVILRNGNEINGTVTEDNTTIVVIKRANGTLQSFRKSDVDEIVYSKKRAPAPVEKEAPIEKTRDETRTAEAEPAVPSSTDRKPTAAAKSSPAAKVSDEISDAKPEAVTPDAAKPETAVAEPAKVPVAKPALAIQPEKEPKAPKDGDALVADKDSEKKDDATAEKTEKPGDEKVLEKLIADKSADKTASSKDDKEADAELKAEEWSPPPGLAGFPLNAKRMKADKEKKFSKALADLAEDEAKRSAARTEIQAMGPEVLPYLVCGAQHTNVDARSACMAMIGNLNGRTAVKHVIEIFYSAMPEGTERAPTWQVPFIRSIIETLPKITGQSFITVEPKSMLVQKGLKQYIDWYNANFDRLPAQLGEPEIDPTDPDYTTKLTEARALKLAKRGWPAPPSPSEIVAGPNKNNDRKPYSAKEMERPVDKERNRSTVPLVSREDALKRK